MSTRRNLIVFLAHGLRSDAVSDCRAWPLQTPYLVKLGSRGLRMIATSACPCEPGGMVSLFTGLHARQHGYVDALRGPIHVDGWPALLSDAGYRVAGVGRIGMIEPWLHEAVPVEPLDTLDHPGCAYLSHARSRGIFPAIAQQRRQRLRYGPFEPDRLLIEPEDDVDGFIGSQARKVLARMPTDRPWVLVVAPTGPANDLPPPTLYDGLVDPRSVEHGFVPVDFRRLDAVAELDYPRTMLQRLEPHQIGRIRADYLGRVSLLDYTLGRLAADLDCRPDKDRTWVVVSSDRGQLLGEHGLVGHRSFLCGAVEVPVMVVPPTQAPSVSAEQVVSTVDVAATVADLAGCDMPDAGAGHSLLRVLREGSAEAFNTRSVVSEFGRRLLLETERFKSVFDTQSLHALTLYDMLNDPDERENLIDRVTGRNILDSLRWRLGDALLPLRAMPGGAVGWAVRAS